MDLKPAVVTPELASAALASTEMSAALRLATWIGDGQVLTESGVLRPADAVKVCAVLGIELPGGKKPRSAMDVPELMFHWEVALWAGLISMSGTRVHGSGVQDLANDPAAVLEAWLRAVAGAFGLPDEPCPQCLTTLLTIADPRVADEDVIAAVCMTFLELCQDCGTLHDDDVDEPAEHAVAAMAKLALFGALPSDGEPGGQFTLTPLGSMLVDSLAALYAPAPEDDAGAVVTRLGDLPAPAAVVFARPWLAARTPVQAARELFDVAETATPRRRMAAFELAAEIGSEAMPAWRERATAPGYGVYVRDWLEDQGQPVPIFPRDEAWMTAESLSIVLSQAPTELASMTLAMTLRDAGDGMAEIVKLLGTSGHPDSPLLIELIRQQMPARAGRQVGAGPVVAPWPALAPADARPYQLMITLREVDGPAVWRRVAVAGTTTLADLHYVIQGAMGWENDHMHAFRAGRRELAGGTPVREALARRGSGIEYEYDFGDGWEHDIRSEGFFNNEPGATLPACLDGAGACPPEDCGGAYQYAYLKEEVLSDPDHADHDELLDWLGLDSADEFDPAAFSRDEANGRLAWLRRPDDSALPESTEQPVLTVVRSQTRGKKPKAKRNR
jgi:hypothetical protein